MSTIAITLDLADELQGIDQSDRRYSTIRNAIRNASSDEGRGVDLTSSFTSTLVPSLPSFANDPNVNISSTDYPKDDSNLVDTYSVLHDLNEGTTDALHIPKNFSGWGDGYHFVLKRMMSMTLRNAQQRTAYQPRFSSETFEERALAFAKEVMNFKFMFRLKFGCFTMQRLCLELSRELLDYAADFGLTGDFIFDPQDIDCTR
jgi:hypothetical protein